MSCFKLKEGCYGNTSKGLVLDFGEKHMIVLGNYDNVKDMIPALEKYLDFANKENCALYIENNGPKKLVLRGIVEGTIPVSTRGKKDD